MASVGMVISVGSLEFFLNATSVLSRFESLTRLSGAYIKQQLRSQKIGFL